jgi:hypothetical protein
LADPRVPDEGAGEALFRGFIQHGFEGLVDDQPKIPAKWLSERAAQTGRAGFLFVSEAIDAAHSLLLDHDERGGIRLGFIREMDEVVYRSLPAIQRADAHWAAKLAKDFRYEILVMVRDYSPPERLRINNRTKCIPSV